MTNFVKSGNDACYLMDLQKSEVQWEMIDAKLPLPLYHNELVFVNGYVYHVGGIKSVDKSSTQQFYKILRLEDQSEQCTYFTMQYFVCGVL